MADFDQLITPGIVGFFQSCEVTQVFLYESNSREVSNVYTLVSFEEKPFLGRNAHFLGKRYPINKSTKLCIQRYNLDLSEVSAVYDRLKNDNVWDEDGKVALKLGKLQLLSKQFIAGTEGGRLNKALKNNFHSGSYLVEFFDESKDKVELIRNLDTRKLEALSDHIFREVPLNLGVVNDRLGNIVFQFPVTMVNIHTQSLPSGDGIQLYFDWHPGLTNIPDCEIEIGAMLEGHFLGAALEPYNKRNKQQVVTGNSDQINHIRIWRKSPNMLLSTHSVTYVKGFKFEMNVQSPEPRIFEIEASQILLTVHARNDGEAEDRNNPYFTHIHTSINNAEKKELEKRLAFKQYNR